MPDHSSAADEHALMEEITAPLADLPDNAVPIAASPEFPMVLRGYDRVAVDAYVRRTSQLVAELQATRSPEAAVRRALERVGEEVAGILQRAHDTSAQITAQSRSEAEDRLEVARREAQQISAAAEARVRELDAETDRIWAERQRIVEDARQLAQDLMSLANSAAERFPAASGDTTDPPLAVGQVPVGVGLPDDAPDAAAEPPDADAPFDVEASPAPDGPAAADGELDGVQPRLTPEHDPAATMQMDPVDAPGDDPAAPAARPDELDDVGRPPDPSAEH
jgi:hypothetical protein